jgi:hypothetical protein
MYLQAKRVGIAHPLCENIYYYLTVLTADCVWCVGSSAGDETDIQSKFCKIVTPTIAAREPATEILDSLAVVKIVRSLSVE